MFEQNRKIQGWGNVPRETVVHAQGVSSRCRISGGNVKKIIFIMLILAVRTQVLGDLILAENQQSEYVLVPPVDLSGELQKTVEDLQMLLKASTGAEFPIVTGGKAEEYSKRIFIGNSLVLQKVMPVLPELQDEERYFASLDEDLVILGGGNCGTVFAVYQFLEEKLGFRFYHYWGTSHIPKYEKLSLAPFQRRMLPSYLLRDLHQAIWNLSGCPTSTDYFRRNRIHNNSFNPRRHVGGLTHTYNLLLPPLAGMGYDFLKDKAYFESNPEFFPMNEKGEREYQGKHRCFSNPGLRQTMTENIEKLLQQHAVQASEFVRVDVSHDDHDCRICHCPECIALEEKYKSPGGPIFDYLIHSASPYFLEKYPNLQLRFLVYGSLTTEKPPLAAALGNGKLPKNLVPYLAFITADFSKPLNAPSNAEIYDMLRRWGEISQQQFFYYYATTFARPLVSLPLFGNVRRPALDFQLGYRHNIRQLFTEAESLYTRGNMGFTGLLIFLETQIANDVTQDIDTLIKEYIQHVYGSAAPLMLQYFYELEELMEADPNFVRWFADPRAVDYLTAERLLRWQKTFDQMQTLVAHEPVALVHLKVTRLNLDFNTMHLWQRLKLAYPELPLQPEAIYARSQEAIALIMERSFDPNYQNHVSQQDKQRYYDWTKKSLLDTARHFFGISQGGKPLPKEFTALPPGRVWQATGAVNKVPLEFDEAAAFGVAAIAPVPKMGTISYSYPVGDRYQNVEILIDKDGEYRLYYLGRTALTRNSALSIPKPETYQKPGFGMMATYARCDVGHLFDKNDPDQLWDIYVSCCFKNDKVYTDRHVLVKMDRDQESIYLPPPKVPRLAPAGLIIDRIADQQGKPERISWQDIPVLRPWRNSVDGSELPKSPQMRLTADSGFLYVCYQEKYETKVEPPADFWSDAVELFFYGENAYPMLQLGIAPSGKRLANRYRKILTSNPDGDQEVVQSEVVEFPGEFQVLSDPEDWHWVLAIPLAALPRYCKEQLRCNFFRSRPDWLGSAAWSPIYSTAYRSKPEQFGTLYFDQIVLDGRKIEAKHYLDGIAMMNGNHGWEIKSFAIPHGLDSERQYQVSALLRCDAEKLPEGKITSRIGVYDVKSMKITGYCQFPVQDICKADFTSISFPKPVNIGADSYLYIGGFIPTKLLQANVFVKSFIVKNSIRPGATP